MPAVKFYRKNTPNGGEDAGSIIFSQANHAIYIC